MSKQVCAAANKQQYPTQHKAIKAALSYSRKRGTALRVYFHKECGSYHLTKVRKFERVAC